MEKNLTALVSCFARAYHYLNNDYWVFKDCLAHRLLSKQEYQEIEKSMIDGIKFFNPQFVGSNKETLEWIVNHQLAPTVLARSAFYQDCVKQVIKEINQFLILGSGLDSFAYTLLKGLNVFEIDRLEVVEDKKQRLKEAHIDDCHVCFIGCRLEDETWISQLYRHSYCKDSISLWSLLGLCYYLSKDDFSMLLMILSQNATSGSYMIFDYPCHIQSQESLKTKQLAFLAGESMKAHYSEDEMEKLLQKYGFQIVKHFDHHEITHLYFDEYNQNHKTCSILPFRDVKYIFARKK